MCVIEPTIFCALDDALEYKRRHFDVVTSPVELEAQIFDELVTSVELANERVPMRLSMSFQERVDDIVMLAEILRIEVSQTEVSQARNSRESRLG
ncbi:MAG: hypothetical protein RL245_1208, partial [Pseudomonadota bacterium]